MSSNKGKSGKKSFKKKSKDKKQDKRLSKLENFVYKTIENKQVNYQGLNVEVTTGSYNTGGFLSTRVGPEDGSQLGDPARIGNTITLMSQMFNMNFVASSTDNFNQMRVLLVESLDGNQAITIGDVLQYPSYALWGDLVFASPYTTKTGTNRRYKVHMDKTFVISGFDTYGGAPPCKNINYTIKYKNGKICEYEGILATSPTNHRVSIIAISDSSSVGHPILNYSSRSTYKDA